MEAKIHPLRAWRLSKCLTDAEAARQVQASRMAWTRWESGRRTPAQPFLDRIVVLTGGEVTANDWLGAEAADAVAQRSAV